MMYVIIILCMEYMKLCLFVCMYVCMYMIQNVSGVDCLPRGLKHYVHVYVHTYTYYTYLLHTHACVCMYVRTYVRTFICRDVHTYVCSLHP